MSYPDEFFGRVDHFLEGLLPPDDEPLVAALRDSASAGLPSIQVSPLQGRLLHLFARSIGARRILEIGTLGGYSTIWLGRALPADGQLVTLEINPRHAEVARANLARAGLTDVVEIRLGPALGSLDRMVSDGRTFDLVFIDADKPNGPAYYDRALALAHPGTLILIDNAVRRGEVADPRSTDPNVLSTREALERMGRDPRVDATIIQTVGAKHHDGFALARVRGPDDARNVKAL